jgi:hypothetical protein
MSPAVEEMLAEISTLTPAERRELLALWGQARTSSARPSPELVNEIKGKYSFVATSSEAFAARKHEEIGLEYRRGGTA